VTTEAKLATEDSEFNPEMTELAEAVVLWFGIPLYVHEQREDRIPPKDGNNLLPVNFILERGEDYNGFTDKPWIVELSVHGMRKQPHLVLDILMTGSVGKDNPSFFIWTVPTMFIEFF